MIASTTLWNHLLFTSDAAVVQLMELPVIDVRADAAPPQEAHEKRHLLRWWNDTSGKDPAEFRAAGPLPCFGERLTDAAGA